MTRLASVIGAAAAAALALFYLFCVHYTEPGDAGIMRNLLTGEIGLDHPGWNLSPPWVMVAHVETRPIRVCISTAGRGFNCRLAQFETSHVQEFVATEGFYYYWWANRVSFNSGYDETYRGFKDLLRGYAYSAKPYPFVTVLESYDPPDN